MAPEQTRRMKFKRVHRCDCGARCSIHWEIKRPNFAAGYAACDDCDKIATFAQGDGRLCMAMQQFFEQSDIDFEAFEQVLNSIDI